MKAANKLCSKIEQAFIEKGELQFLLILSKIVVTKCTTRFNILKRFILAEAG
jgi:hypothetical protein